MDLPRLSVVFILYLVSSTVCIIPEGEYQIGPVFPHVGRFFGHKYFEAYADKGSLKPLLIKKALLGVGAAAAVGGAALIAKKVHENKHLLGQGFGWGNSQGGWYPQTQSSGWYPQTQNSGWYPSSSYSYEDTGSSGYNYNNNQQGYSQPQYQPVKFPGTTHQYSGYDNEADGGNSGGYDNGWSR